MEWEQLKIVRDAVKVAPFVIYCLTIAGLAEYIQHALSDGQLFRGYYTRLRVLRRYGRRKWLRKLSKPLGLCVYCQLFWLNAILYPLFFPINQNFILSIGGVYVALLLIKSLKNRL